MSMNSFHRRNRRPAAPAAAHAANARPPGSARADSLLVSRGLCPSRTVAQRLIAAQRVVAGGETVLKSSQDLPEDIELQLIPDPADRYVSRGGLKLAGALDRIGVAVAGRHCLDVGQSTGGFTDCLLQAGAARVVGVDVGHGQLHPALKKDARVVAIEGVNCRTLGAADLGDALPATGFDLIVGDVSFISLTLILPQLPALLAAGGDLLLLVKPQFEVGPGHIGKGGIVRDRSLYRAVENKLRLCAEDLGLKVRAWLESPITGGDGNHEFFIWLNK